MAESHPSTLLAAWNGPNDEGNPQNWSATKKLFITATYSLMGFCLVISSSIFIATSTELEQYYRVSDTVATLTVTLFNIGSSIGSMVWGPLSERYGRRPPLLLGCLGYIIFHLPIGTASNISTIIISRLFEGFFGIASVIIAGGALYDIWDKDSRGVAILAYLACSFIGLAVGPVLGACIITSTLGWRWTEWITMIMMVPLFLAAVLALPETYSLVIFQQRAQDIRLRQQDWAYHAKLDEERVGWKEIFRKHLLRPLVMLVTEPLLSSVSFYLMFVYGVLFLFCELYPIVFMEVRGWHQPEATLPFLIVALGTCVGMSFIMIWEAYSPSNGSVGTQRLLQMIVGGISLTIGLFWFAATSDPAFSWLPQGSAGVFIGCGIFMIFLSGLSYILDRYVQYANSAVAAANFARYIAGAVTPLFGRQMYHALGVAWDSAVLGFISLLLILVPILLLRREKKVRIVLTGDRDLLLRNIPQVRLPSAVLRRERISRFV